MRKFGFLKRGKTIRTVFTLIVCKMDKVTMAMLSSGSGFSGIGLKNPKQDEVRAVQVTLLTHFLFSFVLADLLQNFKLQTFTKYVCLDVRFGFMSDKRVWKRLEFWSGNSEEGVEKQFGGKWRDWQTVPQSLCSSRRVSFSTWLTNSVPIRDLMELRVTSAPERKSCFGLDLRTLHFEASI